MSYKTILVHVDKDPRSAVRIRIAAELAMVDEAHLVGVATTGVSRFLYQSEMIGGNDPNLSLHLEFLRERAQAALAEFEPMVQHLGVSSFESRIINDEACSGVCLSARYADLVVVGQTDHEHPTPSVMSDFPEDVLLNSGRPVLVVPYAGEFRSVGKRVLISWDASREATRAVTNALPLLKRADLVQVVVFNPEKHPGIHGEQPGADIALFLARHGIKVEVSIHTTELDRVHKTKLDLGNALLSLATDMGSDLLVMGGYGHSRFRETVLGGVTHTILETMTLPVLISH